MTDRDELSALRAENSRLIALLESHDIECRARSRPRFSSSHQGCLPTRRSRSSKVRFPPLDTLVLTMPISWKGTLQQYAGRLHREHSSKTDVRTIDIVDTSHPALLRILATRQRGYPTMEYRNEAEAAPLESMV